MKPKFEGVQFRLWDVNRGVGGPKPKCEGVKFRLCDVNRGYGVRNQSLRM